MTAPLRLPQQPGAFPLPLTMAKQCRLMKLEDDIHAVPYNNNNGVTSTYEPLRPLCPLSSHGEAMLPAHDEGKC